MRSDTDTRTLTALLDWYREMGVDSAVADTAVDWLARADTAPGYAFRLPTRERAGNTDAPSPATESKPAPAANAPRARSPAPPADQRPAAAPRPAFAATPPDAAELTARRLAIEAPNLEALEAALRAFDGCGLKTTAKNLCVYRGAPRARLMIIGEAPGREEDLEGRPFVGRAGQLLDRMLAAIGLREADVHITNVVYWRPPGNRTPTPQESQVCRPFLDRQMELVAPEVVLLLGGAAAKQMLKTDDGIMRLRGRWKEIECGTRRLPTMATLHPAYLLRTPAAKRQAWRDLLAVKAALDKAAPA